MDNLYELSFRANINVKHTDESEIVIYEDHRTVLNVLFYLKTKTKTEFPVNVILFDDHDDAVKPSKDALRKIKAFNKKAPDLQKFWTFTEFSLKNLDDDWVKAGMELGLINNLFLFNSTQSHIGFVEHYNTMSFGTKRLYNLGYLWDALSYRGCLYDVIKHNEFGQLWEDLGWVYSRDTGKFSFNPTKPYIVDFDLDCFTTQILGKRIAIPEDILIEKFQEFHQPSYHYYYSYDRFVKDIIKDAQITTMCFEQGFCGGFKQAFKVFETVDYLFFENQLGK